jgi:hypothetical protein
MRCVANRIGFMRPVRARRASGLRFPAQANPSGVTEGLHCFRFKGLSSTEEATHAQAYPHVAKEV